MVILNRILKLDTDGREVDVPIRIYLPTNTEDHWQCEYEIGWPNEPRRRKAFGIGSVQALLIAMQHIGAEIYSSEAHRSGRLMWHRRGGGYGFPVHSGLRDLHEGDDKSM